MADHEAVNSVYLQSYWILLCISLYLSIYCLCLVQAAAAVCVLGPEQFVRTHSEYSMVDVIIIVALLADPRCCMEFGKLFTWVFNNQDQHCKYLHLHYISTTTLEMYASSASGVRLQDVVHYIYSTSISCSSDVLQFKYVLSVVLYTVKNILPFGEGMFT